MVSTNIERKVIVPTSGRVDSGARSRSTRSRQAKPTRQRSRSTEISTQLLDAALALLASEGVDAITVRNVATHAGVAPAGVYSRFEGKSGLLDALLRQGFESLHRILAAASGPSAHARLVAACEAYRAFALENPEQYQLMFDHKRVVEMSADTYEVAFDAFSELVTRVKDAQAADVVAAGTTVDLAQQIWSAIHGAVSLELNGIGFAKDAEKVYRGVVHAMLRGLSN
jgi:AcrR family transcriptional regulator